jgi:hypothetical protein
MRLGLRINSASRNQGTSPSVTGDVKMEIPADTRYTPETELLLCCARTHLAAETAGRVRTLLQGDLDWTALISAAEVHGVTPLLYSNLNAIWPGTIPKASLDPLRDRYQANAKRSLKLLSELSGLLKDFAAHGIRAIPFKGPALAESIYGNATLRESVDLDVLVEAGNLKGAKDLLLARGCQQMMSWYANPQLRQMERFQSLSEYNFQFIARNTSAMVELHWMIVPRYYWSSRRPDWLWDNPRFAQVAGVRCTVLSPETLLLVLSIHGSKHCWAQLKWICDVAELIRSQPSMEWDEVLANARSLRCQRMVFLGLLLAETLLGAQLPPEVSRRAHADSTTERLLRRLSARICECKEPPKETATITIFAFSPRYFRYCFSLNEHPLGKLRWYRNFMALVCHPTDKDWGQVTLPDSFFFVYYIIRLFRLSGTYGSGAIRSLVHKFRRH